MPSHSGRRQASKGCTIHRIENLDFVRERVDSHSGEESSSVLQPIEGYAQIIPGSLLGTANPVYARIKRCADGSYLLVYHNTRIGSDIYYTRSRDLLSWDKGQVLFARTPISTPQGNTQRKYSSADATVLSNGDIVACVSFRADTFYRRHPELNGIMMRRSSDNGVTWSDEQIIYRGTTWEPYILEMPDGRLECYFTDTDPLKRNSGTSIVVSADGGHTWTPDGVGERYPVIRQYKYDNGTVAVYTDQMPCVRMLNDGHTLLGFMEARMEENAASRDSKFYMSLVYARDRWPYLGEGETGPVDRQSNMFEGAAGYVSQFRSGETLLSCNTNLKFGMKLGSSDGRRFNGRDWASDWYQPFPERGYWGATEVISDHEVAAVCHSENGGIQLGVFYLNHRIDAPRGHVKVDGDNGEWPQSHALFVGGPDRSAQTVIRAIHNRRYLSLLIERSGVERLQSDVTEIYVQAASTDNTKLGEGSFKLTIFGGELKSVERFRNGEWRLMAGTDDVKYQAYCDPSTTAYLAETAIPLAELGLGKGDIVRLNVIQSDGSRTTTFTGSDRLLPATWMPIRLR